MSKLHIIIVENDLDEQLFMQEGFAESNLFHIQTLAANGEELFERLQSSDPLPDLILSDLNMPGKNGYDILKEIKANPRLAHIPVAITSTSFMAPVIEKCLSLGACCFLQKPELFMEYATFAHKLLSAVQDYIPVNGKDVG